MGDDEYDVRKARYGNEMKRRLGLDSNPLDGTAARVRILWSSFSGDFVLIEFVRPPKLNICSSTS
jgi:hypothetical protein